MTDKNPNSSVKEEELIVCDETYSHKEPRKVIDEDFDFEYQMCYGCSRKMNEAEGFYI